MDPSEPVERLRSKLRNLKDRGQNVVPIDDVLEVLGEWSSRQEWEMWRAKDRRKLLGYRLRYLAGLQRNSKMFQSVIAAGQAALKSAILINGGAAVAVLAYMGSLVKQGNPNPGFSRVLLWFGSGVLLGALGAGGTYLTQWKYARKKIWWGHCLNIATISCVVVSLVLFTVGCLVASRTL